MDHIEISIHDRLKHCLLSSPRTIQVHIIYRTTFETLLKISLRLPRTYSRETYATLSARQTDPPHKCPSKRRRSSLSTALRAENTSLLPGLNGTVPSPETRAVPTTEQCKQCRNFHSAEPQCRALVKLDTAEPLCRAFLTPHSAEPFTRFPTSGNVSWVRTAPSTSSKDIGGTTPRAEVTLSLPVVRRTPLLCGRV